MSRLRSCLYLALMLFAAGFGTAASATLYSAQLSFDFVPCHACYNLRQIAQDYGDEAGVIDIAYIDVLHPGESLRMWDNGYNDLHNVAYARGGNAVGQSHGRIELRAVGDRQVGLDGMDFGAWANATRMSHIRVGALGSVDALFAYDGAIGAGATTHTSFLFDDLAAAGGLWIDWFDTATDVGIDNLRFTVSELSTPVPEPESFWLMLGGLVLLARSIGNKKSPAVSPVKE